MYGEVTIKTTTGYETVVPRDGAPMGLGRGLQVGNGHRTDTE